MQYQFYSRKIMYNLVVYVYDLILFLVVRTVSAGIRDTPFLQTLTVCLGLF